MNRPVQLADLVVSVDDARAVGRLRRLITLVVIAGLVACAGKGGSSPADPTLLPPGATATEAPSGGTVAAPPAPDPAGIPTTAIPTVSTTRIPLPGFGEVLVQVRSIDGQVTEFCLLLAETDAQLQRGLMEVTDPTLGGYDGMLFRMPSLQGGAFWMRNTPTALSIAFLDETGALVSTAQMEPCADSPDCPSYPAAGPFLYTVEAPVAAGGVARLGLAEGAVLIDTRQLCPAA